MNDEFNKQLEELRRIKEIGNLSEDTYQVALKGILLSNWSEEQSNVRVEGNLTTSVGERGVLVGGNVGGNINTGNFYYGKTETVEEHANVIGEYCRVLMGNISHLSFPGMGLQASDNSFHQEQLTLMNIYIEMSTRTEVGSLDEMLHSKWITKEDSKGPSILDAVIQNHSLVVTGAPGGGKSTFLFFLASCLAANIYKPDGDWLSQLKGWPSNETYKVPILIFLRDFVRNLPKSLPAQAKPNHLWKFIKRNLKGQDLEGAIKPLAQALREGKAFLLFEGLDEVVSENKRVFVRNAILAFVERYHSDNRVMITCRTLAYQPPAKLGKPDLRFPKNKFPVFEIAPLNEVQINQFVVSWYVEMAILKKVRYQDVDNLIAKLQKVIQRPDLYRLAINPLLLTAIATIHTHKKGLPETLSLLYEEAVDILLRYRDERKAEGGSEEASLSQLLKRAGRTNLDLKKVLWKLAYEIHAEQEHYLDKTNDGSEELANIEEMQLIEALAKMDDDEDLNWARLVLESIKRRAGLLVERSPSIFTFPHYVFQEYLAGAYLTTQHNFARKLAELAEHGTYWREIILLAVDRLIQLTGDTVDKPLALVNRLCLTNSDNKNVADRNVWLAGDVLLKMGLRRVLEDAWGQDLFAQVQKKLVNLVETGGLSPQERARVGLTLGLLGDPREGVCTIQPDVIEISAGVFLMGEGQDEVHSSAFAIDRYLVTNAQFQYFIEDGGYTEKWQTCWSVEGFQQVSLGSWDEPQLWRNDQFNQPNQPVVGVSWFEAEAYCNWLSCELGESYRLPTESEWERTARHTDGRQYPWGDKWIEGAANYKETGIDQPSIVGNFPLGKADSGVMDLSGNVLEWCATHWIDLSGKEADQVNKEIEVEEQYQKACVIKGGSWGLNKRSLRCSYRSKADPFLRNGHLGFRVVRSFV